jgi:hypothetical protein
MSYTPFDFIVFPIFLYYGVISIFSVILTIRMMMKWRERKVNAPLYLSLVFTFFTAAIVMLTIGLAEAVITGFYKEIYRFSLPFAYSMVVLADMALFRFVIELTNRAKRGFFLIIISGLAIIAILFLPWNWWGVPHEDYEGLVSIRLYSTLALIVYSYVVYIIIASICFKALKKSTDPVAKVGFQFLFAAMISMILFFLMFVMDTLMIVVFGHPGYSIYVYIAWIFAILALIFMYVSLVMPKWVEKRIIK